MTSRGVISLAALACALASTDASAYPTYHRLGYVSCVACHASPTGGGLLTVYGQGISNTATALLRDESEPTVRAWSAGLHARAIGIYPERASVATRFLMQADALIAVKPVEKWRADLAVGLALTRGAAGTFAKLPAGQDAYVVRRALVSFEASEEHRLQVGRDFLPQGIAIDDHTTLLRSRNRRGVLDYPTQARLSWSMSRLELMPFVYLPSYEESAPNREAGAGARAEWSITDSSSVGGLVLLGESPALRRAQLSLFTRWSTAQWNGLLAEYVYTRRSQMGAGGVSFPQHSVYLRPSVSPLEWGDFGIVFEVLALRGPLVDDQVRIGPSVQLRVTPWASWINEMRWVKSFGLWDELFTSQLFIHL